MKYFVYILKSDLNNRYYIGYSKDPDLRLERHNQGWTKSTKSFIPWKLIYIERYESKTAALGRERQIKSWKSRKAIDDLIHSNA